MLPYLPRVAEEIRPSSSLRKRLRSPPRARRIFTRRLRSNCELRIVPICTFANLCHYPLGNYRGDQLARLAIKRIKGTRLKCNSNWHPREQFHRRSITTSSIQRRNFCNGIASVSRALVFDQWSPPNRTHQPGKRWKLVDNRFVWNSRPGQSSYRSRSAASIVDNLSFCGRHCAPRLRTLKGLSAM